MELNAVFLDEQPEKCMALVLENLFHSAPARICTSQCADSFQTTQKVWDFKPM